MKKKMLAVACMLTVVGTGIGFPLAGTDVAEAAETGTTYYISSIHGDNAKRGTSASEAWETLDKLIEDVKLKPGDSVLLEKGSVFNDAYIHLYDVHGTADAPIVISSYGEGNKPVINANGQGVWYQSYEKRTINEDGSITTNVMMDNSNHKYKGYVSSAILLYDVDFVEISDLEITNESDDFDYFKGAASSVSETSGRMDRTGVSGIAKDGGTSEHIYLDNLYIHDVDGNIEDKHMNNGGIQMNVIPPKDEAATGIAKYHDVKITNCYVRKVSRAGICVGYSYQNAKFNGAAISDEAAQKYGQTDLVIENNYVKDIGNDAIVAMYSYRPLVQYNISDRSGADMDMSDGGYASHWQHLCAAVWPWKCKDGVFQYNEVFDTVGDNNQDAQAWDIDYSDGTVYQYNYSHNNGGGAIMFCGGEAYNGVFRYNISQNDLRHLMHLAGNPNGEVYNNVFYIDGELDTQLVSGAGPTTIRNNIFYNISSGRKADETIVHDSRTYSNNIFYGYDGITLPEGSITEDPKFADPGKAPNGVLGEDRATLHERSVYNGYKLQSDSPAINAGVFVEGAPKYDFFGNRVGLVPDIGAFESNAAEPELGVKAVGKAAVIVSDTKISEAPSGMTVKELEEQLIYAQDVTFKVLNGGQEAGPEDVLTNSMQVQVARGGETKSYTLEIAKEYKEYDPSTTTATAGSAETSQGEVAAKVCDGDISTIWHTAYAGCEQSQVWVELDLGEVKPVAMVKYVSRSTGGANGVFRDYKVQVRSAETEEWQTVDAGTWSKSSVGSVEYSKFDTVNARYVRLEGTKTLTAPGSENKVFGSASEIHVGYEVK